VCVDLFCAESLQPIHLAALNSNEHVIEMLINAGADVTAVAAETRRTCLHLAALSGNLPAVVCLLAKHRSRCDVNATSSGGWTPLHLACQTGKSEIVAELLKYGADDSLTLDNDGETALYVAAAHGRCQVVELMLKRTTVCRKTTSRAGWSELHAAAAHGHADTVELLVKFPTSGGKQLNHVDEHSLTTGETALQVAARAGHVEAVRTLIAAGANCDVKCALGLSPLYVAAGSGHVDVVRLLLEQGTLDVNGLNGHLLRTALHVAGNVSTAKALIDGGAKVNIRDGPGRTPMKLAVHEGRTDVAQLLLLLQAKGHTENRE
jgi:ankyrin repeat protein